MKTTLSIGLGIAIGLASVVSYADTYDLGTVHLAAGSHESIKLSPLKEKFLYTVTCNITNNADPQAAIKISQSYNNFGSVVLDDESLNKNNDRETVQGKIKPNGSTLIINNVNDNSGFLWKDYLTFDRSKSDSKVNIDIHCTAEAPHNPTPPAPPASPAS